MRVVDQTNKLTSEQCQEIRRFVVDELLSGKVDRRYLKKIVIRDDGYQNYFGYWQLIQHQEAGDPPVVTAVAAVIVLNAFFLKTLSQLKKTLAHEYGHHWTLCHLIMNQGWDLAQDRIPEPYYRLRGLDLSEYAVNYSKGWNRCDREVIAEDYRILFAPPPQNHQHGMDPPLEVPDAAVKDFIVNLAQPRQPLSLPQPAMPADPLTQKEDTGNPFRPLSGRIERPEEFFGRSRELREIFELLNAGSSVELLGVRQMGKSSMLWRIKEQANSQLDRQPIYLNLQEVHTEAEFYESLCEKIGIATTSENKFPQVMKRHRVLLLLDQIEKVDCDGFSRHLRDQLRSLAEGDKPPLRLVVATATPLDRLFPDSSGMTSPLQGICSRVELTAWDPTTVQEFIQARLRPTGMSFSAQQMQKLWQISSGHPQKLMKACFDVFRELAHG